MTSRSAQRRQRLAQSLEAPMPASTDPNVERLISDLTKQVEHWQSKYLAIVERHNELADMFTSQRQRHLDLLRHVEAALDQVIDDLGLPAPDPDDDPDA